MFSGTEMTTETIAALALTVIVPNMVESRSFRAAKPTIRPSATLVSA